MSDKKLTFLITSGATKEYIDPIRFISNDSSGKMGVALAKKALSKKHKVIFICAKTDIAAPQKAETINVVSAGDMFNAVKKNFHRADIVIGAAAVADFSPLSPKKQKIKKGRFVPVIKLKKNPDIIAYCGKNKKGRVVAGFALETENLIDNALSKLKTKKLDLIAANGKESLGSSKTSVSIITKNGSIVKINNSDKNLIAGKIINETIGIFTDNKIGKKSS